MKEYEKQKDGEVEELKDIAAAEKEQMKQRFEETEKSIVTKRLGQSSVSWHNFFIQDAGRTQEKYSQGSTGKDINI